MRAGFFLTLLFVGLGSTSPARRDCGLKKCYDAVNECNMRYGGCWTECADGVRAVPTFTVPLCSSDFDSAAATVTGLSVQLHGTTFHSDANTAKLLVTTPPNPYHTKVPRSGNALACSPLWLCVDNMAVCGDSTQMYGGCYDICTSRLPYTSPPCNLSSSTTTVDPSSTESVFSTNSGYAIATPTIGPGTAYTTEPPADSIAPALDDSKALVMAEMPSANAAASAPQPSTAPAPAPDAEELRIANVPAEQTASITDDSELIEAPQSLRGAAIAKVLADTDRTPNTANIPCWDSPSCKEVQLGIPSPLPSSVEASSETTAAPTAESSPESSVDVSVDGTVATSANASADAPAATLAEPSVV